MAVRSLLIALVLLLVTTLASCGSDQPTRRLPAEQENTVSDLVYWKQGDTTLLADACLPAESSTPRASVILVHGGAFVDGSRTEDGMKSLCRSAAAVGVAAFTIDYRLAPDHVFPSQVVDLQHAVEWLRQPAQVQRFDLDPARIGLLGSSAGAILAQTAATQGSGRLDRGSRVKAVVSLSGVSEMTPAGLKLGRPSTKAISLVLTYLGCRSIEKCTDAARASAITEVDKSDPPMLLVNGSDELVPAAQARTMGAALESHGVKGDVVIVDGDQHGAALLNSDVRRQVQEFLAENL